MSAFLHVDDCPFSINVLLALRGGREWSRIGCEDTPSGLSVDWEQLLDSYLSTSEKATVRLVQALAPMEGHGGLPLRVQTEVRSLIGDICAHGLQHDHCPSEMDI